MVTAQEKLPHVANRSVMSSSCGLLDDARLSSISLSFPGIVVELGRMCSSSQRHLLRSCWRDDTARRHFIETFHRGLAPRQILVTSDDVVRHLALRSTAAINIKSHRKYTMSHSCISIWLQFRVVWHLKNLVLKSRALSSANVQKLGRTGKTLLNK